MQIPGHSKSRALILIGDCDRGHGMRHIGQRRVESDFIPAEVILVAQGALDTAQLTPLLQDVNAVSAAQSNLKPSEDNPVLPKSAEMKQNPLAPRAGDRSPDHPPV